MRDNHLFLRADVDSKTGRRQSHIYVLGLDMAAVCLVVTASSTAHDSDSTLLHSLLNLSAKEHPWSTGVKGAAFHDPPMLNSYTLAQFHCTIMCMNSMPELPTKYRICLISLKCEIMDAKLVITVYCSSVKTMLTIEKVAELPLCSWTQSQPFLIPC